MNIETLAILIVVGILGIWLGRKLAHKAMGAEKTSLIERQKSEKAKNLRKLLEYFKKNDKVTNDDVEKLLDVSDSTATNYLQELKREGLVKQHGREGKGVYYTLNG